MLSDRLFSYHQEYEIRDCLERWVSELEPCLVFHRMRFMGLGLANRVDGKAKVYVRARKIAPLGRFHVVNASSRIKIIDDDA